MDIRVLYQTDIKGAFCECSFSHQACIKSTRILEQAKVERGKIQNKIQGGVGGSLMVCRLAPSCWRKHQGFTVESFSLGRSLKPGFRVVTTGVGIFYGEDPRCKWGSYI